MKKTKKTQKQKILLDLLQGKKITQADVISNHSCYRLAPIIHTLRKTFIIKKDMKGGYATYWMEA